MDKKKRRRILDDLLLETHDCKNKDVFLWGTGNTALLYQEGFKRIECDGFDVKGYVDNNAEKWGGELFEKRIFSPDELLKFENIIVLIVSPQPDVVDIVGKQLDELRIEWEHVDEYIFKRYKRQLLNVFDLLEDAYSRKIFVHLVKRRMKGQYPSPKYCENGLYFSFPLFVGRGIHEVFVDCGAYVGDSIENFIWSRSGCFGKIIAIEPDINNYKALKNRIERLKNEWVIKEDQITILPYAVADHLFDGYLDTYDNSSGLSTKLSYENDCNDLSKVLVISIDEYINEPFDLLKADIEGNEYKMLVGAKNSIRKYKPNLAISIYHNAVDFYSIILLLHEMVPEYKFSIRHYSYKMEDTVLYAYV